MSANNGNGGYISLVGLLGVAFVVLKLCDVIDWSWWWVTIPFWGPLGAGIVTFAVYFIAEAIASRKGRR